MNRLPAAVRNLHPDTFLRIAVPQRSTNNFAHFFPRFNVRFQWLDNEIEESISSGLTSFRVILLPVAAEQFRGSRDSQQKTVVIYLDDTLAGWLAGWLALRLCPARLLCKKARRKCRVPFFRPLRYVYVVCLGGNLYYIGESNFPDHNVSCGRIFAISHSTMRLGEKSLRRNHYYRKADLCALWLLELLFGWIMRSDIRYGGSEWWGFEFGRHAFAVCVCMQVM